MIKNISLMAGLVWVAVSAAQGQAIPDPAGILQQRQLDELERSKLRQLEQQRPSDVTPVDGSALPQSEALSVTAGGPAVVLKQLLIEPASQLLSAGVLAELASALEGREVQLSDLQQAVNRINALYAEAGHFNARALLPPQSVSDGVVRIQLVEGRLGELRVENNAHTRNSYFAKRVRVKPGEVINLAKLSADMQWFNRTSDVSAQAKLAPGAAFGETDIALAVNEGEPLALRLYVDNTGSESTGEERYGVAASHASLLGLRDQLSVNVVGADGELGGFLSYSLPVNRWNGRVGASYALTDIEIVNGGFSELTITGESETTALFYNQPLYVGHGFKLESNLSYGDLTSETELDGIFLQRLEMEETVLGMALEWIGQQQYAAFALNYNDLDSKALSTFSSSLITGNLSYLYRFDPQWSATLRGAWQHTSDELLPSARLFQVGGFSSVRGYPEGAVSGNKGYFFNLEAQYNVLPWLSAFVFYDFGEAVPFRPGDGYSATADDQISSIGLGANLRWRALSVAAVYGSALEDYQNSGVGESAGDRLHLRIVWNVW